jgi:uncharacterized membrane protein YwzB
MPLLPIRGSSVSGMNVLVCIIIMVILWLPLSCRKIENSLKVPIRQMIIDMKLIQIILSYLVGRYFN